MIFPFESSYRFFVLPAILLLIVPSVLRAYFLMPLPGSQDTETIALAYHLEKYLIVSWVIGGGFLVLPVLNGIVNGGWWLRIGTVVLLCFIGFIFWITEYKLSAKEMFKEPSHFVLKNASENAVPLEDLVMGIEIDGIAHAYPVQFLAYHHKLIDTLGKHRVMPTYCSMCRTGRVYQPIVDGADVTFRLVGARHYNAIVEDSKTKSWWYQATGECAVGTMKGAHLSEVPFLQMSLRSWLERHPNSLIMQEDTSFSTNYEQLKLFPSRQISTERWSRKSWVVGLEVKGKPKAYDWQDLLKSKLLVDTVGGVAVRIELKEDGASFIAEQEVDGSWIPLQSYQENWHSWKQFHPNTDRFEFK